MKIGVRAPVRATATKLKPELNNYVQIASVKLSRNRSKRLRGGMGCWASILTVTFGTTRTAEVLPLRASCTLRPRKFLGAHFWYRLRGLHSY
jgi:hypothetical protein